MEKPESVRENQIHNIHWGFEILKDHLIPVSRPDLVLKQEKITWYLMDFAFPCLEIKKAKKLTNTWILSEKKKQTIFFETVEYVGGCHSIGNLCTWNGFQS